MKIKLILSVLISAIFPGIVDAQCPQLFNYQTIVRDAAGNPVTNTPIAMRFTIDDSINSGVPVYKEVQNLVTNQFGHISAHIGTGQTVSGTFSAIEWSKTSKYMQVEIDNTGGSNFYNMGIEKLASDPYALYVDSAAKGGYPKHYMGEYYGGGIVFFVTDNGQHGLIADSTDLQTGNNSQAWSVVDTTITNAVLQGTGGGSLNTERIIIKQDTGSYAAQLCANYSGGGFGDWFLPSAGELNLLYGQRQIVGGFSGTSLYWSSTETAARTASAINFASGAGVSNAKSTLCNVRAVRTF